MKDYAIYFFTLILGVAIFYVFNAIESQTVMMKVTSSTREIIELMTNMLSGVSVFVSFILGFLIIYASRFLIKRRNKEFGIYLTLGMSKRKISLILFFETILIGLLSLVIGLILGVLLSQLMSILVANMFEADMTNFTFVFSEDAMIKTFIYFGIMYLLVMIFNTIQISKCKLIDLIYSSKKSEKIKIKNSFLCIIIFIISSILLGYAYYKVTSGVNSIASPREILTIMAIGAVTTFLIFWSLSGLILKLVMSMKKVYYKGLNSFILRQVSSKINTTVFSMTIICLMLFVTICVLSSSLSIKNSMTANLKELAPVDILLSKTRNIPMEFANDYGYNADQIEDSYDTIDETLQKLGIQEDEYLTDQVNLYYYIEENLTLESTLGKALKQAKKTYPSLDYQSPEVIVKLSDYNKVAQLYGNKTYQLKEDEYMIIADLDSMVKLRNEGLKENTIITIDGKNYHPKYQECQDGFIEMSSNHINAGILVVPDTAIDIKEDSSQIEKEFLIANYKAETEEEKQEIEEIFTKSDYQGMEEKVLLGGNTKLSIYEASVGLGALVTFIGLYLGIIFLISSAAILALKELSESTDNKERFCMLRKIGTDEKMIHKALFWQIAIFFAFPLILAMIHSFFGIQFCSFILETFGEEKMLASVGMTAIFLIVIYGGYFILTYYCSKNIIKEK